MHRVAEYVRTCFSDDDELMSNGKNIFIKLGLPVETFINMFANIALKNLKKYLVF